ncbi:hypothetical protein BCR42DRAFT_426876 [Absidia repens]|uniref:Uncharacterized protein n=1 Tax=Absidia repens TaxID=90262 RepID=A0A1X2I0M5_9FUNG|nr:hypothetical protein BCR42DRAFT_426876 [Absidia repens]
MPLHALFIFTSCYHLFWFLVPVYTQCMCVCVCLTWTFFHLFNHDVPSCPCLFFLYMFKISQSKDEFPF